MTLRIDSAGRIAVPKTLRDRLGLRAGMDLEISETSEGLTLTFRSAERVIAPLPGGTRSEKGDDPSMVLDGGFWVHRGKAPDGFDWNELTEGVRDQRHREVGAF